MLYFQHSHFVNGQRISISLPLIVICCLSFANINFRMTLFYKTLNNHSTMSHSPFLHHIRAIYDYSIILQVDGTPLKNTPTPKLGCMLSIQLL